ncbi:myosin heavy chain 95F-like isoform X3 [Oratosquilla oratoria]|uniref:myosin heavy chain 95F-like isoform X3 n=1 Tax=Oratosquilla oratoria TaxID=337810 RepID=UPI003F760115
MHIPRTKAEMEAQRKIEEEEQKRQEYEDRKAAEAPQAQLEKEARELEEEQERRDHELALRLASETNSGVDDLTLSLRRSSMVEKQREAAANKKFDLSKWKYSELRDTINTSCDLELLEACWEESHRRQKAYHAWKAKDKKRTTIDENQRAPKSVLDAARGTQRVAAKPQKPGGKNIQRYFCIPHDHPSDQHCGDEQQKKRWRYAHFDGDWIARQMELHPEKPAILLVSGQDDMQMCKLSLDETGLTRKRGAEILDHEFEKEWVRHSGGPYQQSVDRRQ